nr:ribonuclease H-like domain-containing protein [Tanacetum cinerariifolium]
MNPIATQQADLDTALVPPEKRLKIERCNARIALRESRAQILWGMYNKKNVDYVALLWEDFMYQTGNKEISPARKEQMPYPRFIKVIINHLISKEKTISMRNMINLYTIRDDSLLDIKDSEAYKTYYDFATGKVPPKKARKYKKVASPSRKLSPVKEAEPVKKAKRVKRLAKKSATAPTSGVVIRDTPSVSVMKKKAPPKGDRSKGIELLSDATLLSAAQVPDESKDKTTGTDEGTGTKPGVLDVPSYESDSDNESWGDSEDESDDINDDDDDDDNINNNDSKNEFDDGNDAHDSEGIVLDENPSFTLKDYDEEHESDEDYENVYKEEDDDLFKDVDVILLGAEHEKEREGDEEMTDADQNVSQEKSYEQVIEDAHVHSLLYRRLKAQDKALLFYPTSLKAQEERRLCINVIEKSVKDIIKDKVKSLLPHILPKQVSDFATPVIKSTINESLDNVFLAKSSSQPKPTYEATKSLTEFELKKILLDKIERSESYKMAPKHKELYEGLVKYYNLDKDLFSSYGKDYSLKRDREDKDKNEALFAGSDRGLKKHVGIKSLLDAIGITAAEVFVNTTLMNSEMLDQTFDKLQKLVSQLELLGEKLSQEDVNQKLLRSLSPEWNTHAVVWRNKADLDTMSMGDLYNNLKVYEPQVKGMSSSSSSTQNMAFVSSSNNNSSSTNRTVNTAQAVNTANEVFTASTQGCRALRNQDNKHKESSRMSVPVETTNFTALVLCDGLGEYDWRYQAEEDEFANKTVVENKSSEEETKSARKDAPIIEEWVSDDKV